MVLKQYDPNYDWGTRSQALRRELAKLVLESEQRQEARMESRLQGMVTKLKGLIASLGKQSLEQSTDHSRLGSSTTADT